ncbi:hypothetical protein PMIT1327_01767 [Prochlorococcus marinus str. MIT 1327]|nr:hypothetical protein PMIT1312_02520 [Prochlorococcus marinus str. MIT 1312]KZR79707.1 hypothetical protein PMIT1327_01767 [Prochlorococcus marinus str. MIT 1327]
MTIGLIVDHHGSEHLLNDWFKHVSLTPEISVNIQFRSGLIYAAWSLDQVKSCD